MHEAGISALTNVGRLCASRLSPLASEPQRFDKNAQTQPHVTFDGILDLLGVGCLLLWPKGVRGEARNGELEAHSRCGNRDGSGRGASAGRRTAHDIRLAWWALGRPWGRADLHRYTCKQAWQSKRGVMLWQCGSHLRWLGRQAGRQPGRPGSHGAWVGGVQTVTLLQGGVPAVL